MATGWPNSARAISSSTMSSSHTKGLFGFTMPITAG